MMYGYGSHLAAWQAALMWIGMIIFLSLVVWAVYALIASANRKPEREDREDNLGRILDQRLARGEIDAADYRRSSDLAADGEIDGYRSARRTTGRARRIPSTTTPHR